ncbi:MAG: methyl-accepting chemotaxis protein [Pseudomonadota bacterium]
MRLLQNISIRVKLPVLMIAMVIVTLLMADYLAHKHAASALRRAAEARLEAEIGNRAETLSLWSADIEREVVAQGESPFVTTAFRAFRKGWLRMNELFPDGGAPEALRADFSAAGGQTASEPFYRAAHDRYHGYFHGLVDRRDFADVFLVNTDGDVVYSARKGPELGSNLRDGPSVPAGLSGAFEAALKPEPSLPAYGVAGSADGVKTNLVAHPLRDREGTAIGVLIFELRLDEVRTILSDRANLGATGQTLLVDPRGNPMGGRSDLRPEAQAQLQASIAREALSGRMGQVEVEIANRDVLASFRPLPFLGETSALIVLQSAEEIAMPETAMMDEMVRDGGILLVLAVLAAFASAQSVTRPLAQLQAAMARIRRGHHEEEIPFTGRRDEIGRMARALADFRDAMVQNEELARDSSFKGAAFEGASAAQTLIDLDMRIAYANQAFEDLLVKNIHTMRARVPDLKPREVIGRSIDIFQEDPERIRGILSVRDALPYRLDLAVGDLDFVLTFSTVRDHGHDAIGYVVEWKDVTEERMREAMLEAINTRQVMAEFDMSGQLVTANPAFCTLMTTPFEGLRGRALDDLLQPAEARHGGGASDEELPGQSRFVTAGTERILEGGMTTVLDREGVPTRLLLIGQDITRDHEKLLAAEAAKRQLMDEQAKVMDSVSNALAALARGDLSERLSEPFAEGYDALRVDLNHALEMLSAAMRGVLENADAISAEAGEITNAAQDLSRRTENQAVTLEETAAALDVLTKNLALAAGETEQADAVVRRARDHAQKSGDVVSKAVEAMGQISDSSREISRIISVIDDIAFQTNLLALNAGVEAARAGDAGRGFAVVASEVRALAQRSADAAREITALISKSGGHVELGVEMVGEAGRALRAIVETIEDVSSNVSRIASSATEQSGSIAEINAAVTNLDRVTQQNAAMFEETTAASHALTTEAAQLRDAMAQFRVSKEREPSRTDDASDLPVAMAAGQDFLPAPQSSSAVERQGAVTRADPASRLPVQADILDPEAFEEPNSEEIWEEF